MVPLVSIVIPVYNVDRILLQSCIQSALKQTYSNIEIVVVNDGSSDDTYEYCRDYANNHSQIYVLNQNNLGVSAARNRGTQKAKGEFILYADADDVLSPIAVEEGMNFIMQYGVDIVIACVEKITSHDEFFSQPRNKSDQYEILKNDEIDELRKHYMALNNDKYLHVNGNGYINRGPYCKLINKSVALKNQFPEGLSIGEDLIWNMSLLNQSRTVCIVFNQWYGYLMNDGSAIHKYYGDRKEKVEEYLKALWNNNRAFCEKNIGLYGKNMAAELYCLLRYELMSPKCNLSNKEKREYVQQLLKDEPWNLLNTFKVKKNLPLKSRVLLELCPSGLWIEALKILYRKDN